MEILNRQNILQALTLVVDPDSENDIVSCGFVKDIEIREDGEVFCRIEVAPQYRYREQIRKEAKENILQISEAKSVTIEMPGINYIIPVASGKGGVGKSTVSANLAIALAKSGAKVGLLDADVYGPSQPLLLGIKENPMQTPEGILIPAEKYGLKIISMGFFLPEDQAIIWRGPMLQKMIVQFLRDVEWGELDYLIIDLPPGTGDVQLTLCQQAAITGAVVVSTPQTAALNIAKKAIFMFHQLNSPVIGLVENMSYYVCGKCQERDYIFGENGTQRLSKEMQIPFLGEIPISTAIRNQSDNGVPIVEAAPDSPQAQAFHEIANKLVTEIENLAKLGQIKIGVNKNKELQITWQDDKKTVFPSRYLRLQCRCAQCVEEMTGQPLLDPQTIRLDIEVENFQLVGNYGVQIFWSDRHSAGIFTFDHLREISQSLDNPGEFTV